MLKIFLEVVTNLKLSQRKEHKYLDQTKYRFKSGMKLRFRPSKNNS